MGVLVIVGDYALYLYCDDPRHVQPVGEDAPVFRAATGSKARQRARKRGWKIKLRDGTAFCPECLSRKEP